MVLLLTFCFTTLSARHGTVMHVNPGRPNQGRPNTVTHKHNSYSDMMEFPLITDNAMVPEIPSGSDTEGQAKLNPGQDASSDPLNEATMEPPSVDCGHQVDGTTVTNGTIVSPGFPDNYPAFLNCKWSIKGTPGKKILASFREFDV